MSRGGNGEVARVTVAFGGDTTELQAAAAQAEAIAKKAAENSQNFTITNLKDPPIVGDADAHARAIHQVEKAYEGASVAKATANQRLLDFGRSARATMAPISTLISVATRFTVILGLVVAAVSGVIHILGAKARSLAEAREAYRKATEAAEAFAKAARYDNTDDAPGKFYKEEIDKVVQAYDAAIAKAEELRAAGQVKPARMLEAEARGERLAAFARVTEQTEMLRRTSDGKSVMAYKKASEQAEFDIAKARAAAIGGASGAILDMIAEEKKAYDTLYGEALRGRLAVIQIELEAKLAAAEKEAKEKDKQHKEELQRIEERKERELEAINRVASARREAIEDIRRDQVGDFGIGSMGTSSLDAGSLDLLLRQSGGSAMRTIGGEE